MRLYLLRHGEAEDTVAGLSDSARILSPRGIADVRAVGRALVSRGERFDVIAMSPLVRAVQTAQIVADASAHPGPLTVLRELMPGGEADEAVLTSRVLGDAVLLVGHEPQMSAMAIAILGAGAVQNGFLPGMLAAFELPQRGRGTLRFILSRAPGQTL